MSREQLDIQIGEWSDSEHEKFDVGRGGEIGIVYPPPGDEEKDCVDTNTLTKEDTVATKMSLKVHNKGQCDITVQLRENGANKGNPQTLRINKKFKAKNIAADGFTITCGNCEDKKCKFDYSYGFS